jgi:hypothetical protein
MCEGRDRQGFVVCGVDDFDDGPFEARQLGPAGCTGQCLLAAELGHACTEVIQAG